MPDYWIIYLLIFAFGFGGGFVIGLLIRESSWRDGLLRVWTSVEKISSEVHSIENKLSERQSNAYQTPPKITLNSINEEILKNYSELKRMSQEIRKNKLPAKDTKKPTITRHSSLQEEKEVDQIEDKFNEISNPHSPQDELFSDSNQYITNKPDIALGNLASQIVNLYNRGVYDRTARNEFWEKFSITRIGNNNAVAQRMGEVSVPDFRESGNGDFLAVQNDDNQTYLVVPLFDTTITSSTYNEGGIGFAFNCPNYDSQSAYSTIKVNRPAVFRREGERWFLIDDEKGELILQN